MSRRFVAALALALCLATGVALWWSGTDATAPDEVAAEEAGPIFSGQREVVPVPAEPQPEPVPVPEPRPAAAVPPMFAMVSWRRSTAVDAAPPGTVLVRGGTTIIGATVTEIEAIGARDELVFPSIVPETPQHERQVDDLFLMVNEVTNEQYAAFVRATGHLPPWTWGEDATNEARQAFLEEQALRPVPERKRFDAVSWWGRHGEGKPWAVPPHGETRPVTFTTYDDARAYAEWAGLRLMTELEYQRACRGDSARKYPWGDDVIDLDHTASLDGRSNVALRVGELPQSRSAEGVAHLAGNVWEWTASPFLPYPGYRDLRLEVGEGANQRLIDGLVKWDRNQRVAVGGGFQSSRLAVRCTTRRPTDRVQRTDALGFRCAASPAPGVDRARAAIRAVRGSTAWAELELDPARALVADHWRASTGSSSLPGYAVIEAYDCVLFVPAADGMHGVLVTTVPVRHPELHAGTYVVTTDPGAIALTYRALDGAVLATARPSSLGSSADAVSIGSGELVFLGHSEPASVIVFTPRTGLCPMLVFAAGRVGADWRLGSP